MKKELIDLTSEFWDIPSSEVTDNLKLDDQTLNNNSSVRFFQFITAVESNLNVKVKNINKIRTFKDLSDNIDPA